MGGSIEKKTTNSPVCIWLLLTKETPIIICKSRATPVQLESEWWPWPSLLIIHLSPNSDICESFTCQLFPHTRPFLIPSLTLHNPLGRDVDTSPPPPNNQFSNKINTTPLNSSWKSEEIVFSFLVSLWDWKEGK